MANLQNIFFNNPLIDIVQGYSNDGIDPTEMLNFFFKKTLGIANAKPYTQYYDDLITTPSYINTFQTQQYSQFVPSAPPTDIINDNTFVPFYSGGFQYRYYSQKYPYLAYYETIVMANATKPGDYNYSFYIESNDTILTKNAIPLFYGLNKSNFSSGTNYFNSTHLSDINDEYRIFYGDPNYGSWLFDTDSGILTFYDTPPFDIGRDSPPRISFWRYEGLIGNSSIVNVGEY
jgi:hypothetical protein